MAEGSCIGNIAKTKLLKQELDEKACDLSVFFFVIIIWQTVRLVSFCSITKVARYFLS